MNFSSGRSSRRSAPDLDPDHQRAIAALGERLREPPAREVRAHQLERIVAEARSAAAGPQPARLPGLSSKKRARAAISTGVIVIGLPATAAGLATAGVKLPEPAISAFEAIGVTLPNQASGGDERDRSAGPRDRAGPDERRQDRVPTIPATEPTRDPGPGSPLQEPPTGTPDGTPSGPPEGTPSGPPEGTPSGAPEGTPNGAPEGAPSGPPEGTPSGPPAGAPSGSPEGAASGPPEGAPSESSAGTSGGVPEGIPSGPAGTPGGDRAEAQAQDVGGSAAAQRE